MAEATQIIIAENWEFMKVVSVPESERTAGIGTTAILSVCPLPLFVNPSMDCGLTTAQIAAKDIPAGVKYEIIDKDKYDEYLNVGIGSTVAGFYRGEEIVGQTSGAKYACASFNSDDANDKYKGKGKGKGSSGAAQDRAGITR